MERIVDAVTPLGQAIWFRQMTGKEAISSLFEFDVTFHSKQTGLSAKAMLGKGVTLKVETEGGKGVRPFNGICTRFASGGREGEHLIYTAKLRPWLWLASRRSDCKIFQFMKVEAIIKDVLGKYGFPVTTKLKKTYREWDYCVQYQETDLNFVMRLMEHEGMYFFFQHSEGSHALVIVDDVTCHASLPGKSSIKYYGVDAVAVADEEHFNSWQVREEVNSGEYITDDYDFENPRSDLTTKRKNPLGHSHDSWERYMWPGGYVKLDEGETYAGVRLETLEGEHERTQGHTTVRTMAPGYLFNLERCPRGDQNREYLSVAATYFFRDNARMSAGSGGGDADWGITVTSQPTSIPYRPQPLTPKPLTHGPQTAVVVGPEGEEIYTDKYGRVKVQFFWDRYGQKNEKSSCWIRCSHPWAGEKWGFIHIPRIGQEVIVDFIGGDPDYPMITGRVYNADQMPPYALPDNKTASGIKSRSTKGGGPTDFNEIRMEDLKGKEQLYIHAQRNYDTVVELDESRMVGHDRSTRIEHDDDRFVNNDDRHVVTANQTHQVGGNQTTRVGGNQDNTVDGNQSNMVKGNRTQSVDGKQNEETGGDHLESVHGKHSMTVGSDESLVVAGNQTNLISGDRSSTVLGSDSFVTSGSVSTLAAQDVCVTAGTKYAETTTRREATVFGDDSTEVKGMQRNDIMGLRQTTISGGDTTTINGIHSHTTNGASTTTVAGAMSVTAAAALTQTSGAAMSLTAGGIISISASGMVTINATAIILNAATVICPGTIIGTTAVVSPLISPCPTNKF